MTIEEAKQFLTDISWDIGKMSVVLYSCKDGEKMREAIQALEQEPCEDWKDIPSNEMTLEQARSAVRELREMLGKSVLNPICEDAVSRQAAIDALRDAENHAFGSFCNGIIKAHKIIADLPSVNSMRKRGKWIDDMPFLYRCSNCNATSNSKLFKSNLNFCPKCGSDNREDGE